VSYLLLENKEVFKGNRIGAKKDAICEVVFNTSMVGYVETFTDPSYAGQGIVMTYPLIGNYGYMSEDKESNKVWAKAVIVNELAEIENNFRTESSLENFLSKSEIPGIKDINTRKLTKVLRENGTMRGMITDDLDNLDEKLAQIKSYKIENATNEVGIKEIETYGESGNKKVCLIDFGYKKNILNALINRGVQVEIIPSNMSAKEILKRKPDGIMVSNGPGNPEDCKKEIETIKELYNSNIPMLGVSLGHQLIGLATGAKISKLKYGHRGSNHPVKDIAKDRVFITSQNHGYHIDENSIDKNKVEVTHYNLNDNTIEGLKYKNKKVTTVQFYPEKTSEKENTGYVFDEFIKNVKGE